AGERAVAAIDRGDWKEFEQLFAPDVLVESRRKITGFKQIDLSSDDWRQKIRRVAETGVLRANQVVIAVRGERLALCRLVLRTADATPGASYDEMLQLYGIGEDGRIAVQVIFDVEDVDAAIAELDATHAQAERAQPLLENTASRVCERFQAYLAAGDWPAMTDTLAEDSSTDDRRRLVGAGITYGRDLQIANMRAGWDIGYGVVTSKVIATRGDRLILSRVSLSGDDQRPEPFQTEMLRVLEINADERMTTRVLFDVDNIDAAFEE